MAALDKLPEDKLKVKASFQTGLQVLFLAAVFFFFALFPFTNRYTFTNGSAAEKRFTLSPNKFDFYLPMLSLSWGKNKFLAFSKTTVRRSAEGK